MNPRLPLDWLRYLVTVGGFESDDGWRWKIDPAMRFGGFGPWRPEWTLMRLPGLPMPFLGFLGTEREVMGWGHRSDEVLPLHAAERPVRGARRRRPLRPHRAARRRRPMVLDFLGGAAVSDRRPTIRHGKIDLALHQLRAGPGDGRSPAVAAARPRRVVAGRGAAVVAGWPGPVAALDFTGHGDSTVPHGGGYTAEILLADADAALGC